MSNCIICGSKSECLEWCGESPRNLWYELVELRNKVKKLEESKKQTLIYCRDYLEYMWAANTASLLLNCDFRDSKEELEKFLGEK
jgi:lysyl-tRNA synthetase class I